MESAARTLDPAVLEPCCAYPRAAGEAGVGAFGAAPFEPPGPAVDASVRVSRRSFSPWIQDAPRHSMAKALVHDEELLLNREPSGRCSRADRFLVRFWSSRAAVNCALRKYD